MKVFFNGWYSGFIEKTNANNVSFFLNLFNKIYDEEISIGTYDNSDILCEFDMLINSYSVVNLKNWKHTYLFSGEYKLQSDKSKYTCVLWGERNYDNVVNLPLYISYMYCNNIDLENQEKRIDIPKKEICAIISNPNGVIRNRIINKLDEYFDIDYLGEYKNNIGGVLKYDYNSEEFANYIKDYKFIIAMENNRNDTYITEKIIHGFKAKTIPIYWGSNKIFEYFNRDRFLGLLENEEDGDFTKIDNELDYIMKIMSHINNNDDIWLNIVNRPCYPININDKPVNLRTIEDIIDDIKCVLKKNENPYINNISKIYCISSPIYENENYNRVMKLFNVLKIDKCFIKCICPTYKHTITEELYKKYVNKSTVFRFRKEIPMKKAEISLFFNYKSILENIKKNNKEGIFIIFESDIMLNKDIYNFNKFLDFIITVKDKWDFIHIGEYNNEIFNSPSLDFFEKFDKNDVFIEDITDINSEFRMIRKLHPRCCDSIIWKYEAVVKFLDYMDNIDVDYDIPLDYYITRYLEKNNDVKHYWTLNEFFIQGSNNGYIKSSIQNDLS
jgi:hypothetical protein